MRAARILLAASGLLLFVPLAAGSLQPPPARLVGTYAATLTKNYPAGGLYAGRYKIVIGPSPKITYIVPGEGPIPQDATFVGNRVTFFSSGACVTRGTYTWRLEGRTLTFTKIRDQCPHRALTLVLRWRRVG
jgi:hypothetical protein